MAAEEFYIKQQKLCKTCSCELVVLPRPFSIPALVYKHPQSVTGCPLDGKMYKMRSIILEEVP